MELNQSIRATVFSRLQAGGIALAMMAVTLLVTLSGCDRQASDVPSRSEFMGDRIDPDTSMMVRIGVTGRESVRRTYLRYAPLVEYLADKLQRPTILVQRRSFEEINTLFRQGILHFAWLSSGAYVHLRDTTEHDLLVMGEPDLRIGNRSVVLVHEDSPIHQFGQLRGKTFALVDRLSLSGYAVIACLLSRHGATPESFFSTVIRSGSHDKAMQLVSQKYVDGACVSSLILNSLRQEGMTLAENFRTIYTSESFPTGPLIAKPEANGQLTDLTEKLLLNMLRNERGKDVLHTLGLRRFVPASEANYNRAKDLVACSLNQ